MGRIWNPGPFYQNICGVYGPLGNKEIVRVYDSDLEFFKGKPGPKFSPEPKLYGLAACLKGVWGAKTVPLACRGPQVDPDTQILPLSAPGLRTRVKN